MNQTITFTLMFAIIGVIGTIYSIYNSIQKNNTDSRNAELKKAVETAENFTKINMKLDESCRGIKAIQLSLSKTENDIQKLNNKVMENTGKITTLLQFKNDVEKEICIINDNIIEIKKINALWENESK